MLQKRRQRSVMPEGRLGHYIADALYFSFGYFSYLLPLCFAYVAWMILKDHWALRTVNKPMLLLRGAGLILMISGGCGLLSVGLIANSSITMQGLGGLIVRP